MFKNLVRVYCVCILFVSAVMIMVTTGILLSAAINYNFVEYKNISALEQYSTNEKFIEENKDRYKGISSWSNKYTEEKRTAAKNDFILKQRNKSIETFFDTVSWLFTSLLFLIIHIFIYKKYKNVD